MHNKRIGRDDLLKIEVQRGAPSTPGIVADPLISGLGRHLLPPGALTLALTDPAPTDAHQGGTALRAAVAVAPRRLAVAVVTTPRARTTAVSATMIDATETAREAPMTVIGT